MLRPAQLPNARLTALLGAWLLLGTATWALTIALAVYAYSRSGTGAVAAVLVARLLPAMLVAPFTGRLLDRGDRRRVVAAACLVQVVCLGVAAALMADGAAIASVTVLAALSSAAATTPRPGLQSLLPALAATPEELSVATALWTASDNGGFLLGSGVGGVLIAATSTGLVVAGAALCTALAAALTIRLPAVTATASDDDESEPGLGDVLAGVRTIVSTPLLRAPFALFAGLLLLEGTTDVQLVALALGKLGMGQGGPGILFGVWGIGGVLASAGTLALVRRRGYGLVLALGAGVFAAGVAVSGFDRVPVVIAAMVPAGIGFALVETAVMAIVPRLADDEVAGRVYAVGEVIYAGGAALGALIAPLLISTLGISDSLIAVGVAFGGEALMTSRACGRLDVDQEQAGRIRTLLRGVPFLEPLPLPRLERLVRSARPLDAAPGTAIVTAGEVGHEFYVIEAGTVSIEEYGRTQTAGSGFGEIALLRDVPRTATVRAVDDVHLWSLGRPVFLAAVTGHGDASHLADAVVAEYLGRGRVVDTA